MNINSKNRSSVVFIYCLILFVSIRNANVFFISDALHSLVILFRWVWKSISHGQTFSSFFVRSLRPVRAKKKGRKKKEGKKRKEKKGKNLFGYLLGTSPSPGVVYWWSHESHSTYWWSGVVYWWSHESHST